MPNWGRYFKKVSDKLTFQSFFKLAIKICEYHHEKWDSTGYPHALKGDNIPISARIMAVADVYGALSSKRPYKQPLSHEKSVEIIKADTDKHFDRTVVKIFLHHQQEFKNISEELMD